MRRPLLLPLCPVLLASLVTLYPLHANALRTSLRHGALELHGGQSTDPQNSTVPEWQNTDNVCADWPYGWADSSGNSCRDYEQNFLCTKTGGMGAGWLPVWGSFSAYAAQNHTAASACCACGGGRLSCCPRRRSLEAELSQELAPLRAYVDQLGVAVAENVSAAGAEEAERFRISMASQEANVSQTIISASSQLREQKIASARARFDNQTMHRENLTEAAEDAIVQGGYAAARGAVDYGNAKLDQTRLMQDMQGASTAIHAAATKWEEASTAGKEVVRRGTEAMQQYFPDTKSTALTLGQIVDKANTFLEASQQAREEARFSLQATAVATDVSQATDAQSQAVDAQVRQAMDRAQTALRATGQNSGKLDRLEAMVEAAEGASEQVSQLA